MMKLWHTVIIGIAIIAGFALHSAIRTLPEHAKVRRGYEMQVRMMEMTPKEITIGDTSVLYLPKISYRNLSIDVDYEFYSYVDGELKKINLTKD
jgi:hypothetical protein